MTVRELQEELIMRIDTLVRSRSQEILELAARHSDGHWIESGEGHMMVVKR